ncbi:hypothetical protein Bbelb_358770 [Branchiostoma belcheri]|nr:hypothetical protein Bbelb_358770 [Branchiostoma belcheri]
MADQPPPYQQGSAPMQQPAMQHPVMQQPGLQGAGKMGAQTWVAPPQQAIPGCPPGLEYLTQIDQIIVHQQIELFEAFTNVQMANKYAIKNSMGQQIFFAYEDSEFCMRICCGPQRSFTFHVLDNAGHEVMRMRREFKCCAGCPWCASCARDCCAFEVYVESPPGQLIGMAIQSGSKWKPHYEIMNANGESVFHLWGPCCVWNGACCTCDVDFNVYGTDQKTEIGKITRNYAGFAREFFTQANHYSMSFPLDLDVKLKAVLMGAMILVDFMFYEQPKN